MDSDPFSMDGSVAIVTGRSRGIGGAIAVAMARAGADVAPIARTEDALRETADQIEDAGSDACPVPADVTDGTEVEAAFDAVEETLGEVDVLVNNAGTNPFFGNATNLGVETWEHILDVNVTGALRCAKAFGARVLDREGSGALVNVASVGGVVALPYQVPYTASKHAMVGMTKCLAVEWSPDVRVNALAPGYVKTGSRSHVTDGLSSRVVDVGPKIRDRDRSGRAPDLAASIS